MSDLIRYFSGIDPAFMWLFGIVVFGLPILKIAINHFGQESSIKQKNLELLLSAYKSGEIDKCNEFIVEHIVSGIYKSRLSFPVIQALLNSRSPIESFELYKSARPYIKLTHHTKPFRLKKKYGVIKLLGYPLGYWVSIKEMSYYLLSAMTSFALVTYGYKLLSEIDGFTISNVPMILLVMSVFLLASAFFVVALQFLRITGGIRSVKRLLKLQLPNHPV